MRHLFSGTLLWLTFFNLLANNIHHSVSLSFNIDESFISVKDEILFPSNYSQRIFYLNKNLIIQSKNIELVDSSINYFAYKLLNPNTTHLSISYSGVLDDQKEALSRPPRHGGQSDTHGIIFEKGIYLSGQTYWLPHFKDQAPFTFDITAKVDSAWTLTSQGTTVSKTNEGGMNVFSIVNNHPTQQAYLVGNKWCIFETMNDDIAVQAFLITPDTALAKKYMGMTKHYLSIYEEMFGNYPYDKFALVENFWETGYGMPSFTLLGQRVIRMPWILHSSYPHELLHNYWGNGVFVDYDHGNWSEGLTTYFADFFFKEQKNEGAAYRHKILKEYADYVTSENNFPLVEFKVRTSKASSSIGYGKSVMSFHMLSEIYGREQLLEACRLFYQRFCFKEASFYDLKTCIEEVIGESLDGFFAQWVESTDVPSVSISDVSFMKRNKEIHFTLNQTGTTKPYKMHMPIRCLMSDSSVFDAHIEFNESTQECMLKLPSTPISIAVDPDLQVMRLLHSEESPLTLSSFWGAKDLTLVLPTQNSNLPTYVNFATSITQIMAKQRIRVKVINDTDAQPHSKNLILLGDNNRFSLSYQMKESLLNEDALLNQLTQMGASIVSYKSNELNIAQLNINDITLVSLLLRKITHYGDFAYLGFTTETAEVTTKGIFPIVDSPMRVTLTTFR